MWFPSSLVLLLCSALVAANTEKAIFLGPAPSTETSVIGDLEIPQLAPSEHCTNCRAIRTRLATTFAGEGAEHWVRIDGLDEGRRYEVRICWAATQPTDFTLDKFTASELLAEPALLAGVRAHPAAASPSAPPAGSVLYLRILAKTAYYSSDKFRMENPEPVDVDIILDPYLYNLVPESLLRIIGLILVVAPFSWFLGGWIHRALLAATREDSEKKEL